VRLLKRGIIDDLSTVVEVHHSESLIEEVSAITLQFDSWAY
jgi:hypothetical protein